MNITLLRAKIHRATVTATEPDYEGSISVDRRLLEACGIMEFEKVLVADVTNGQRFETYCLSSPTEGLVCVNGAAARLVSKGDLVIIMAFGQMSLAEAAGFQPAVVRADSSNRARPAEKSGSGGILV
ncbi:MAG: aspartate 1-decarboxylase [Deltaproteobacteria bacterium]|nr:aspartate 1-decarboxylase [Deltaproteobacteria bacterium]